jgi:HEAT repeats
MNANQLRTALLFAAFAVSPLLHAEAEVSPTPDGKSDVAFTAGTDAMNSQRWYDAVRSFDEVIRANGPRTDAALYWKAYNLGKLHRTGEARAICNLLHSRFSSSAWNNDCRALLASVSADPRVALFIHNDFDSDRPERPEPPERIESRDPDSDIKMLALNSLMQQDPNRALPLLRGILSGNNSMEMKKHAIFALAQSKNPEAQKILDDAVRGKMDAELQRRAIEMMAVFQGKRSNATLVEVYKSTSDPRVKKAVLNGLFISQDAPRMVDIARSEKDLQVKRQIVSQLALMHDQAAQDYMLELLK